MALCKGNTDDVDGSRERRLIRLATFNVHGFVDAAGADSFERVKRLLLHHQVDVVCLQEAGKEKCRKLYEELKSVAKFKGFAKGRGCAIISRYNLDILEQNHIRRLRYVSARLKLCERFSLVLTCLHLNHRYEGPRRNELSLIERDLESSSTNGEPQIWAGDFNALTLNDYTEEELETVAAVRRANLWEEPLNHVTEDMTKRGFRDSKQLSPKFSGPLSTCRYNTRIDYLYLNAKAQEMTSIQKHLHVGDDASDHNMVIVEIQLPE